MGIVGHNFLIMRNNGRGNVCCKWRCWEGHHLVSNRLVQRDIWIANDVSPAIWVIGGVWRNTNCTPIVGLSMVSEKPPVACLPSVLAAVATGKPPVVRFPYGLTTVVFGKPPVVCLPSGLAAVMSGKPSVVCLPYGLVAVVGRYSVWR